MGSGCVLNGLFCEVRWNEFLFDAGPFGFGYQLTKIVLYRYFSFLSMDRLD